MPQQEPTQILEEFDPQTGTFVPVQGLTRPSFPPSTAQSMEREYEVQSKMGQGAATAMDLASLALPIAGRFHALGPAIRMSLQGLLGAGSGAIQGTPQAPEGGVMGALTGGAMGGALQGGLEATRGGSRLANRTAYRLGGLSSKGAEEAESALNDINRIFQTKGAPPTGNRINDFLNEPAFARRLPVGAQKRTDKFVKNQGKVVAATREADPTMMTYREASEGAMDDLLKNSVNTPTPLTARKDIKQYYNRSLKQHFKARPRPLTTKERADLEVGLKHSPEAENLIKARKSGELITAGEKTRGQYDEAISKALRESRYASEGPGGPMRRADELYAKGKIVQGANQGMRSPELLADPGKLAARGGLGSGTMRGLGALAGAAGGGAAAGPGGAIVGSVLGPVVLSPYGMSQAGYLLDNLARTGVSYHRLMKVYEDLDKLMRTRGDNGQP